MVPPEYTRDELDFLERELGLAGPGRLLDLPCGAGRHALELARRGHRRSFSLGDPRLLIVAERS